MYSFVRALAKVLDELGGTINTGVTVEEILFLYGKAIGIKTAKGIEKGDIVVCNADFPYAMKNLVKDECYKDKYTDKKISEMKYTCSTFIIYLGLRKKYTYPARHGMQI